MAAFCVALTGGCSQSSSNSPAPQPPSPASNVLPNGRVITPSGTTSGPVGGMPLNIVLSPDGKYAITTSSSINSNLCSVRVSDGAIVSTISYNAFDPSTPNFGLYYGLVFAPGNAPPYTLYAAQGGWGTVAMFTLGANGTLTQTPTTIPASVPQYTPQDQPGGLALDTRGYLYVTNTIPVAASPTTGHAGPSTLSIFTTAGVRQGTGYTFPGQTPCYPQAITVKSDGSAAYVASERDDCVYVLNTTVPTAPTLTATINTGDHPDALLLNHAQTRLYVANAGSDTISVIDTTTNRVLSTVLLRPSNVSNLPGVTPTGLALSPDEKTLYASLGDFNAVGVIDTATSRLRGYIPVGWYPTAVAVAPDNSCLLVTNGWGTTAMNPNPQCNTLNPDVLSINEATTPPNYNYSPGPGYVLNSIPGNVSRVDLTKALPALAASTVLVVQNTQNTPAAGSSAATSALALLGVKYGNIKHVIYIIKENRGYDQVLGDLPKGNRDPSLTLFGQDITPNQHALAMRFILLDNFYNNAPVSGEGWAWCTQSLANEFTMRNIPYIYRLALSTYQFDGGAFGGQDTNYITGGYPAFDQDGFQLSPDGKDVPPIKAVAEAPGGYIWDMVHDAGLTYRNYGFFLSAGVPQSPPYLIPDNYPTVHNLQPPGHMPAPPGQTSGYTDYDFRQFDFGYAESDAWVKHGLTAAQAGLKTVPAVGPATPGYYTHSTTVPPQPSRFSEWNREFQYMLTQDPTGGTVPNFMMVRFGRDHSLGLNPTFGTPQSMMADNDYAVGELVDAVSHSPIWESTVIFVIEDDAQFSPDHVDAHRSFVQVISPWIKQGTLDSHFYDTNSVLKSMELLLGLPPMSQYDNFANPIMEGWDSAPNNNAPFDAILPAKNIIGALNPPPSAYKRNDPRRRLALLCAKMNFRIEDAAPVGLLNEAIWMSVKGPNSKMPKPRFNELQCLAKPGDDD
ncbi:MAG: alkaline phosphatase family protein [bacterium]